MIPACLPKERRLSAGLGRAEPQQQRASPEGIQVRAL